MITRKTLISASGSIIGLSTGLASAIGMKMMESTLGRIDQNMLAYAGLTVGGGIAINLLSNTAQDICKTLSDKVVVQHPGEMNHDLQKAMIAAVEKSISNIIILFRERNSSGNDYAAIRKFQKKMNKDLKNIAVSASFNESLAAFEVNNLTNSNSAINQILEKIKTELHQSQLPADFNELLATSYVFQFHLCFIEELKERPKAWISFQKIMMDAAKRDLENLIAGQNRIENTLKAIKNDQKETKHIRLSGNKLKAAKMILNEIGNWEKVTSILKDELSLMSNELNLKLNEIVSLNKELLQRLHGFQNEYKEDKVNWWHRKMVLAYFIVVVLGAGIYVIWKKLSNQPFSLTLIMKTELKDGLPFNENIEVIIIHNDFQVKSFVDKSGKANFNNIPAVFLNDSVEIKFEGLAGEPYNSGCGRCKFKLHRNSFIDIPLQNHKLDEIRGVVVDEQRHPIENALVIVRNINVKTDVNGLFTIKIPPEQQSRFQTVTAIKNGYKETCIKNVAPHTQNSLQELMLFRN